MLKWKKSNVNNVDNDEIWGWQKLRNLDYDDNLKEDLKKQCERAGWVMKDPMFPQEEKENYYWVMLECKTRWRQGEHFNKDLDKEVSTRRMNQIQLNHNSNCNFPMFKHHFSNNQCKHQLLNCLKRNQTGSSTSHQHCRLQAHLQHNHNCSSMSTLSQMTH